MWNGSLILGKTTILFLVKFADLIVCEYEREWRIEIHAAIYCDRYELCSCSARVEKAVSKVEGVTSCSVSLLTNSMGVEGTAADQAIIQAVEAAGYGAP